LDLSSLGEKLFDLIFVGNIFSLIKDKEKAFNEIDKLLKKSGFLVFIPMYYLKKPTKKLIKEVSNAIGIKIKPLKREYWINLLNPPGFDMFYLRNYKFINQSKNKIDNFTCNILSREHLINLNDDSRLVLNKKYKAYIKLFNKNLSYMGFSIIILRKKSLLNEDPELFTSKELN